MFLIKRFSLCPADPQYLSVAVHFISMPKAILGFYCCTSMFTVVSIIFGFVAVNALAFSDVMLMDFSTAFANHSSHVQQEKRIYAHVFYDASNSSHYILPPSEPHNAP